MICNNDTITLFSTKMVGTNEQGLLFSDITPTEVSIHAQSSIPTDWLNRIDRSKFDALLAQSERKRSLRKVVDDYEKKAILGEISSDLKNELERIIVQSLISNEVQSLVYYRCNCSNGVFALRALDSSDDSYIIRLLKSIVPAICDKENLDFSSVNRIMLVLHDKDVPFVKYHKDLVLADPLDVTDWKSKASIPQKVDVDVLFFKHQVNGIVKILKTHPFNGFDVPEQVKKCIDSLRGLSTAFNQDLVTNEYLRLFPELKQPDICK